MLSFTTPFCQVISALVLQWMARISLTLYRELIVNRGILSFLVVLRTKWLKVRPDSFTYTVIVPCCDMVLGQQVHAEVVKICSV